jgi:hypothetical protein
VAFAVTQEPGAEDENGFLHVKSVLVFCKNVTRIILIMQTLDREDITNVRSSKNHEQLTINQGRA